MTITDNNVNGLDNTADGPMGQRLALNITPNFLAGGGPRPNGVGDWVKRDQQPIKCGYLYGEVYRGFAHANKIDPAKESIRWHGYFEFVRATGEYGNGVTMYVPGVIERQLLSMGCPIVREGDGKPEPFLAEFSFEIWCEPTSTNMFGFQYAVYDRQPQRRNVRRLCPPEIRRLLPPEAEETRLERLVYDPETGEVDDPAEAAAKAVEGGEAEAAPMPAEEAKPPRRRPAEPVAAN